MRAVTTSDLVHPGNVQIHNPFQNCMDKESVTTNVQIGFKSSEDVGGSDQALQTAGVEFDSTRTLRHNITGSNYTHTITDKCLHQLGSDFGCIPLSDLFTGPPSHLAIGSGYN